MPLDLYYINRQIIRVRAQRELAINKTTETEPRYKSNIQEKPDLRHYLKSHNNPKKIKGGRLGHVREWGEDMKQIQLKFEMPCDLNPLPLSPGI